MTLANKAALAKTEGSKFEFDPRLAAAIAFLLVFVISAVGSAICVALIMGDLWIVGYVGFAAAIVALGTLTAAIAAWVTKPETWIVIVTALVVLVVNVVMTGLAGYLIYAFNWGIFVGVLMLLFAALILAPVTCGYITYRLVAGIDVEPLKIPEDWTPQIPARRPLAEGEKEVAV